MDCAKQAQRLANRVKAADCVAPRVGESAAMNERMGRHGVVEGAVLCVLELAEVDEALVMSARREPRRRSRCLWRDLGRWRVLRVLRADGCVQQSQLRQRVTALRRCVACWRSRRRKPDVFPLVWGLTASLLFAAAHMVAVKRPSEQRKAHNSCWGEKAEQEL